MTRSGPVLLTREHVLAGFDCGKTVLNDWLSGRALDNQKSNTSRTWVVTDDEISRVVAYYASATASVRRADAPKTFGRNQPEDLPAMLLARMAVDEKHQGEGLGAALLKHFVLKAIEVSRSVGVRLALVHAKDEDARDFYQHHGFVESPFDPLTLMLMLPTESP